MLHFNWWIFHSMSNCLCNCCTRSRRYAATRPLRTHSTYSPLFTPKMGIYLFRRVESPSTIRYSIVLPWYLTLSCLPFSTNWNMFYRTHKWQYPSVSLPRPAGNFTIFQLVRFQLLVMRSLHNFLQINHFFWEATLDNKKVFIVVIEGDTRLTTTYHQCM